MALIGMMAGTLMIYIIMFNILGLSRYLITFRKLNDDNIRLLSVLHP